MDGLSFAAVTPAAAASCSLNKFLFPAKPGGGKRIRSGSKRREIRFPRRNGFLVLAAKEEEQPKLDQWDQMELKFGRLLGEDPKLTLAKIMARKENPDASYLEVEKSFYKNKGKIGEREELLFDVSKEKKASNSLDDLNLARPVPSKGVKFQPTVPEKKKPSQPEKKAAVNGNVKSSVPNVILRKPVMFVEDDVEDKPLRSRVRIKSNLTLKMGNGRKNDKFSDMTLLRRPELISVEKKQESSSNVQATVSNIDTRMSTGEEEWEDKYSGFTMLEKPELNGPEQSAEGGDPSIPAEQDLEDNSLPSEKSIIKSNEPKAALDEQSHLNMDDPTTKFSVEAALQGKPKRLDQAVKRMPRDGEREAVLANPGSVGNANVLKDLPSTSPAEDADWTRAEQLVMTGDRAEVELISSSARGFAVAFGSLIGFLPYRNLVAKWKFLAFESWLREKGIDLSIYKQKLGIIGSYNVLGQNPSHDSRIGLENDQKLDGNVSPDMKLEDLLSIYDQEKLRFLASFVGQVSRS
uniref:30S ribosomal protein S1 n=1 Tax=Rhizophora mucronata TaxID=61149 RepID=A0A2P2KD43_RHIMU